MSQVRELQLTVDLVKKYNKRFEIIGKPKNYGTDWNPVFICDKKTKNKAPILKVISDYEEQNKNDKESLAEAINDYCFRDRD